MQALVFHGPGDIRVQDHPEPRLATGDVLIEVLATGICGSDLHGYTGENGRRYPGQVMGHESVGRVAEIRLDAAETAAAAFRIGDLVTINPVVGCGRCPACRAGAQQRCADRGVIGVTAGFDGAFAERMAVPVRNVVPLLSGAAAEVGALIEPSAVGWHAARRGGCSREDRVLVVGGGPIGQACVLAAQRLGAEAVVVSEPAAHRRRLLQDLGVETVDPGAADLPVTVAAALDGPATLVLDAVGTSASLADGANCSDWGARVVLVGMHSPQIDLGAYAWSTQERTLIGSFCYGADEFEDTVRWGHGSADTLLRLVESRTDLGGAPDAFARLANGSDLSSKTLVFPTGVPEPAIWVGGPHMS